MSYPSARNWAISFIEEHLEPPLLHGSEEHQEWLSEELRGWQHDLTELLEDYKNECIKQIS
jgi:hypothetical protein